MSQGAISGDYTNRGDSVNYGQKFAEKKPQKINVFGGGQDSNYLQRILEQNNGNVPFGGCATRL